MSDDRFNEYCEALLAQYTRRNTQTVTQRLESLCGFLRQKGNVVQTILAEQIRGLASGLQLTLGRCAARSTPARLGQHSMPCSA